MAETVLIRSECDRIDVVVAEKDATILQRDEENAALMVDNAAKAEEIADQELALAEQAETIAAQAARIAELEGQVPEDIVNTQQATIPMTIAPEVGVPFLAQVGVWTGGGGVAGRVHNWWVVRTGQNDFLSANHVNPITPSGGPDGLSGHVGGKYRYEEVVTFVNGEVRKFKTPASLTIIAAQEPAPEPEPVPGTTIIVEALGDINAAILAAGPNGKVKLKEGTYASATTTLSNGGAAGQPVMLDLSGTMIIGTRNSGVEWVPPVDLTGARSVGVTDPTSPRFWGGAGGDLFKFADGANNLTVKNYNIKKVGRPFWTTGAWIKNLRFENGELFNTRYGFYMDWPALANKGGEGFVFKNINHLGYSKDAFRFNAVARNIRFENCHVDSGYQIHDEFAVGFKMGDKEAGNRVDNVIFINCSSRRNLDTKNEQDDKYWNGDGFSFERNVFNVYMENCSGDLSSDSFIDTKANNHFIVRPVASENKNNIRVWNHAVIVDFNLSDPHKAAGVILGKTLRGGTGSTSQILVIGAPTDDVEGAKVTLLGQQCVFADGPSSWTMHAHAGSANGVVRNADVFDRRGEVFNPASAEFAPMLAWMAEVPA